MAEGKIFVGRKAELEQFKEVLKNPKGQAVLVVGQAGMGKTWLVDKMTEIAENHPELKCGWVRYEVTPTDSVDSTMALMMDNAFEAAKVTGSSFDGTTRRLDQWRSLLNVINIGDLVMSLKRNPAKNTREQFLERLRLISKRMPKNGRAIFVIDPEKYMQEKSDQSWAIVVKELPEKIKFIFAQRPEGVFVESETFGALDNVSQIPEKRLGVLDEESVEELISQRVAELKYSVAEVREVLSKYKGHPYALQGSLDLLKAGTKLEELPRDPTGIAAAQWKELSKRGKEAIRFFKAYAILEVGVPNEVVEFVSELDTDTLQSLLAGNYLVGLLREDGLGKRIYHTILADYILGQIGEVEEKEYNNQAVKVFRKHLAGGIKQETLAQVRMAAIRLPEHVLEKEGKEAFVDTVVNECVNVLSDLGELETAKRLGRRALEVCPNDGAKISAIVRLLARICWKQGQLNKAELLIKKDMETVKNEKREEDIRRYDFMLAGIFQQRGELDEAKEIYNKLLQDYERLGTKRVGEIYANLGVIYWKRGLFKEAENMQRKALRNYSESKNKEGMAEAYGNFGAVYLSKGNLDKAYYAISKSLELTSRVDVIASMCSNLAMIHMTCGRLDKAEDTLGKTIMINMGMGNIEGAARDLANLGGLHSARGEFNKAREVWIKARDGYDIVGMKDMAKKVKEWIDEIKDK